MKLFLVNITDTWIRKSLELIQNEVNLKQPLLRGQWRFFELSFIGPQAHMKVKHNLGFQPKDILLTSTIGPGIFNVNFDLTDKDNLDITTTDSCKIRAFIGTYSEGAIE